MNTPSSRSVRDGRSVPTALAVGAALLAAIPLVIGAADLQPFFVALLVAALIVAAATRSADRSRMSSLTARLIAVAWWGAGLWIAFLLVWFQSACGCSSPDPASLPPQPTWLGLNATAYHLAATYGGGVLVALAAFGPHVPRPATREPA